MGLLTGASAKKAMSPLAGDSFDAESFQESLLDRDLHLIYFGDKFRVLCHLSNSFNPYSAEVFFPGLGWEQKSFAFPFRIEVG